MAEPPTLEELLERGEVEHAVLFGAPLSRSEAELVQAGYDVGRKFAEARLAEAERQLEAAPGSSAGTRWMRDFAREALAGGDVPCCGAGAMHGDYCPLPKGHDGPHGFDPQDVPKGPTGEAV